jgi:hypothetical protein
MAAQGAGSAKAKKDTRTGCGCLAFIVVVVAIVIAVASSSGGKGSSPEKEAHEYISQKSHVINDGRVDYEHVEGANPAQSLTNSQKLPRKRITKLKAFAKNSSRRVAMKSSVMPPFSFQKVLTNSRTRWEVWWLTLETRTRPP